VALNIWLTMWVKTQLVRVVLDFFEPARAPESFGNGTVNLVSWVDRNEVFGEDLHHDVWWIGMYSAVAEWDLLKSCVPSGGRYLEG
jgi:hypothetical protein